MSDLQNIIDLIYNPKTTSIPEKFIIPSSTQISNNDFNIILSFYDIELINDKYYLNIRKIPYFPDFFQKPEPYYIDIFTASKRILQGNNKCIAEAFYNPDQKICMYFDLDGKEFEEIEEIKLLLKFLLSNNIIRHIRGYYRYMYESQIFDDDLLPFKQYFTPVYIDPLKADELKIKICSCHVLVNYYDTYNNICKSMSDLINKLNVSSKVFDLSVYNSNGKKKQLFNNIYTIKPGRSECYVKLNENVDNLLYISQSFISNACNVYTNQINIFDLLTSFINTNTSIFCKKKEIKQSKEIKQTNTLIPIQTSEIYIPPSIFEGITDYEKDYRTHFDTVQMFFKHDSPLDKETMIYEIELLIKKYEPEHYDSQKSKFEKKFNYTQDFNKLHMLYSWLKKQNDRYKTLISTPDMKDVKVSNNNNDDDDYSEEEETQNETIKRCKQSIYKLENYIRKYKKLCFVSYKHFDINANFEDDYVDRVLKHCFKLINEKYYYIDENDNLSKQLNKTDLFNHFDIKTDKQKKKITDRITCFNDIKEYYTVKVEYEIKTLLDEDITIFKSMAERLLNLIKLTFKNEEDYNFYISWFHHKLLKPDSQLPINIINCPVLNSDEPAQNSLKTYFKDLFSIFIEESKPSYKELIKTLSGSYYDTQLITMEEIDMNSLEKKSEFIEKLKTLTETIMFNCERKGQDAEAKRVRYNFYINTNHDISSLFMNKSDCYPLLKRFKVLQRVGLTLEQLELNNDVLDYFKDNDINHVHRYLLLKYIQELTPKYANFRKIEDNDIEIILKSCCIGMKEKTKLIITYESFDEFKNNIENNYITQDKNKYIKIDSLHHAYFENIAKSTLIYNLLLKKIIIKKSRGKDRAAYKFTTEGIKILYDNYFEMQNDEMLNDEIIN